MAFCVNNGVVMVVQKFILTTLCAYLYVTISSVTPCCPITNAGWKIYPFDKSFVWSSMLFMTGAAWTIVEYDLWLHKAKPNNRVVKFIGEVRKNETFVFADQ